MGGCRSKMGSGAGVFSFALTVAAVLGARGDSATPWPSFSNHAHVILSCDTMPYMLGCRWTRKRPLHSSISTLAEKSCGRGLSLPPKWRTVMRIDPSDDCRQHALHCVRMSQMSNSLEAREIWSDLAKTWLRFASDLEANQGLLDEWGKPKLR
jgi:hypothetical protein